MSRIRRWAWPGLMFGLAGPACTLASGWSDLQGVPPSTDGGRRDSGATPSDETGSPIDAADGDARTVPKEKCAGVDCGAGEICCYTAGVGHACKAPSACNQDDSAFILNCQTKAGCASGDCCLDLTTYIASCTPECRPGSIALCDPAKPECPKQQQCTRDFIKLKACQ
jgi:hypothetical protein